MADNGLFGLLAITFCPLRPRLPDRSVHLFDRRVPFTLMKKPEQFSQFPIYLAGLLRILLEKTLALSRPCLMRSLSKEYRAALLHDIVGGRQIEQIAFARNALSRISNLARNGAATLFLTTFARVRRCNGVSPSLIAPRAAPPPDGRQGEARRRRVSGLPNTTPIFPHLVDEQQAGIASRDPVSFRKPEACRACNPRGYRPSRHRLRLGTSAATESTTIPRPA